jgi:hypothetical protein
MSEDSTDNEALTRGMSAYHAARIELARGVALHGSAKPWVIDVNSGPIVDDYQRAAHILGGKRAWALPQDAAPWCGSFVAYCYRKAGFDMEGALSGRLNLDGKTAGQKFVVFWSAVRLNHYLTHREGAQRLAFPSSREAARKDDCIAWLKENLHPFGPLPGDVLLFHTVSDLSHVGMVASYDPDTFELVTYEGNYQRRVAAARWDLSTPGAVGLGRINVIGRFPSSDFGLSPEVAFDMDSPSPTSEDGVFVPGR